MSTKRTNEPGDCHFITNRTPLVGYARFSVCIVNNRATHTGERENTKGQMDIDKLSLTISNHRQRAAIVRETVNDITSYVC